MRLPNVSRFIVFLTFSAAFSIYLCISTIPQNLAVICWNMDIRDSFYDNGLTGKCILLKTIILSIPRLIISCRNTRIGILITTMLFTSKDTFVCRLILVIFHNCLDNFKFKLQEIIVSRLKCQEFQGRQLHRRAWACQHRWLWRVSFDQFPVHDHQTDFDGGFMSYILFLP